MRQSKCRLFLNGNIITMNEKATVVEAMAIRGDVIDTVGDTAALKAAYPNADTVDLAGRTVMPGIIESHGHLLSLGQSLLELNLKGAQSPEEVLAQVRDRAAEFSAGEWITGWGWDDGAWAGKYPTNIELNKITPHQPVCLRGLHGFAGWYMIRSLERCVSKSQVTARAPARKIANQIEKETPKRRISKNECRMSKSGMRSILRKTGRSASSLTFCGLLSYTRRYFPCKMLPL